MIGLCSLELPAAARNLYRNYHVNSIRKSGTAVASLHLDFSKHGTDKKRKSKPPTATMSDAGHDPTLSDDDVNGQAAPAENADEGTPLNTVEENGLEDDEDDLFGDGDDGDAAEDAPAYVANKSSTSTRLTYPARPENSTMQSSIQATMRDGQIASGHPRP